MLAKFTLKRIFLAVSFLLITNILFAQKTINGKITDANGQPVVGATVTARGGTKATQSNSEGIFSISVPNGVQKLVVTSVGYASQEVSISGKSNIAVALALSSTELSEVVVTALGIERTKKNLQYSITTVDGSNFTQARENSVANNLAGRVAGVNVTKIASGPAASSRVVIRGAKTLGSTLNQPLYVVDGVPIDNTNFGQAGVWGGADQGDGMSSLNPDDIASMTVLKGASAAALYGSRAANGVILITTKKGSGRKGLAIEVNSNYVFETINNLTDFQHSYGEGGYSGTTLQNSVAKVPSSVDEGWNSWWTYGGWGPKFDGQPVVQFDGITRPYSYAGDNWKRFYKTGNTFTNSFSVSGGSETQNFRLSGALLDNTSVFPNSGFKRINLSMSTNSKIGKKLTMSSKILYSNEKTKNRPNISDSPGNGFLAMYYLPGDVNVLDMIGDPAKPGAVPSLEVQQQKGITIFDGKKPGEEFQIGPDLWTMNPYWAAYQRRNDDVRDRVIATGNVRYDITDFLYVSGQAGMDWYTKRGTDLTPEGTGDTRLGLMHESERRVREVNLQYMVGFDKTFLEKFGVNAFFGGNAMRRVDENLVLSGDQFNTPQFGAINNARNKNYDYGYGKMGINSIFGSLELSYNNYLYLVGTARKDWFSTLNPKKNSIVYPSVGASFVLSDALTFPSWFSFAKARASWAQVGNASSVNPYQTVLTYGASSTHVGRPLGGFSSGNNFPNPDLVPFLSTEVEFGAEVRFFKNRLGLDITYYDQKTTDDILDAGISRTSGFTTTSVNLGKLSNKGVEFLLSAKPIVGPITWDVSLNFAKNTSKVISLFGDQKEVKGEEPRTRTVFIKHIVGEPYGVITGIKQLRDEATGLLVYDSSGHPISSDVYSIIARGVPDFTGGINNSFTWKNLNLAFLIDFKSGGHIFSGTNVRMTQNGFTKQTLQGREGEAPLVITGVVEDVGGGGGYKPFTKTLAPGEAQEYWSRLGDNAAENFVYDASFIKLRQVTFAYSLPKRLYSKLSIQNVMLSFVARNLAILYKDVPNIDPESSYTSSNSQGLDYFGFPATRTYGFNLRVTF